MVKKSLVAIILSLFVLQSAGYAQQQADYAKWGRIAVNVAKLNYPDRNISDYQYTGREQITPEKTKDSFKLQVSGKGTTFEIMVAVFYNPQTNSLLSVEVQKLPGQNQ